MIYLLEGPELRKRLVSGKASLPRGNKVLDSLELAKDVFTGIPDLVAKASIKVDDHDIKVN
jgi:hypothetical protein